MKYAVGMGSVVMMYIPSLIKIGSDILTLIKGDTQIHRQQSFIISLLFLNKESRLKINSREEKSSSSSSLALSLCVYCLLSPHSHLFSQSPTFNTQCSKWKTY
jgi:hypothetical protein